MIHNLLIDIANSINFVKLCVNRKSTGKMLVLKKMELLKKFSLPVGFLELDVERHRTGAGASPFPLISHPPASSEMRKARPFYTW